ncbi:unnamed protein product, partial [Vitis vinifera]
MSVAAVASSPIRGESVHSPGFFHGQPEPCSSESILVYLTVAGSVIPLRVLESDSIASVKFRIQICQGFVVKKQKLVFGGRELARNDSLVRDYGVTSGNVLHLVLKLSDLLAITVRTACGKEFEFHVDRYSNVGYLKQRIVKTRKCFVDLEDHEFFCNGNKLDDQVLIDDICTSDPIIHLLVQKSAKVRAKPVDKDFELSVEPPDRDFWLEPIIVNPKLKFPSFIWDLINSTFDGLDSGNHPILSSEGTGGTYFMQDSLGLKYVSVFKPMDEEPMAVNNPRGLPASSNGEGLKRGTRVGEGAVREVAAYVLDHPKKEKVKIGSLQKFMNSHGSCEDMGPGAFPVEEVHKISVFDIRMANTDRHAGNILVNKEGKDGQIVLIPIDHGYCLPENFEDCTFDWLYWPQARQPFSLDTIDYINSLDAEQDIALLKFCGWELSLECARTLRISTMLLKKGAQRGLTPFVIGSIMCRVTLNKESVIEEIVQEAQDSLLPGMSEAAFLETISQLIDTRLDKLMK